MKEKNSRASRGLNKWMTLVAAVGMAVVMIVGYFNATDESQMREFAPDDIHESKKMNIG